VHDDPATAELAAFIDAAALEEDPRPGTRPLAQSALGVLGIDLIECSPRHVVARMPVYAGPSARGAMLVLAETAASTAAGLAAGTGRRAFGAELNASFLTEPTGPAVVAEATPWQLTDDQHVWRIVAVDETGTQVLESRCTLSVVDAPTS
jgi:uncharacterized protein (TIGR00369 family)